MHHELYVGIDFGTSGARAIAIDPTAHIQAQATVSFGQQPQTPDLWRAALLDLLGQWPTLLRQQMRAIAVNGTSSTVLLCDHQGRPLAPPLLYNDARGGAGLESVKAIAPPHHTVISPTSSLAKLLWLTAQEVSSDTMGWPNGNHPGLPLPSTPAAPRRPDRPYFLHQADWLSFQLHGRLGISDYHNALKLGYDVEALRYPDWMAAIPSLVHLPQVVAPGTAIAPITAAIAAELGLPRDCWVCAGTTDSIAAFLASGATQPGEAVTSLGSTLVLKLLSQTRIEDATYGIYSHRLGNLWLVGGASNTGGAVLQQFFSRNQLEEWSARINPDQESPLDYYPLTQPGERFPINDAHKQPHLEPRPTSPVAFLHGLLESMARIEARGYRLLHQFGAPPLTQVYTAGGGAKNEAWTRIRARQLGVPVVRSPQTEAAYGTAWLAMRGVGL